MWRTRLHRTTAILALAVLAVSGCGAGGGGLSSCEDVAGAAVSLLDDRIQDDVMADPPGDEQDEVTESLDAETRRLRERAEELGCSDEEMAELMQERIGEDAGPPETP